MSMYINTTKESRLINPLAIRGERATVLCWNKHVFSFRWNTVSDGQSYQQHTVSVPSW